MREALSWFIPLIIGGFIYFYLGWKLFPIKSRFAIFLYSIGLCGFIIILILNNLLLTVIYLISAGIVFVVVFVVIGL